jgi:hypothetical protein
MKRPARAAHKRLLFWLRVMVAGAGIVLYLDGLSRSEWQPYPKYVFDFSLINESEGRMTNNESTGWHRAASPEGRVIRLMSGAGLVAVAFFLWGRRFSLKRLMAIMAGLGVVVAIPTVLLPLPTHREGTIFVGFDHVYYKSPLTEAEVIAMSAALQPRAAAATLPDEFLRSLAVPLEEIEVTVQPAVVRDPFQTYLGLRCELRIPATSRGQTVYAIYDFYKHYAVRLAQARMNNRGHALNYTPSCGRLWGKWSDAWDVEFRKTHPIKAAQAVRIEDSSPASR